MNATYKHDSKYQNDKNTLRLPSGHVNMWHTVSYPIMLFVVIILW